MFPPLPRKSRALHFFEVFAWTSSISMRARYSLSACWTIRLAERAEVGSDEAAFTRAITHAYKSGGSETPVTTLFWPGGFFFI